jgi:hypothetical protein
VRIEIKCILINKKEFQKLALTIRALSIKGKSIRELELGLKERVYRIVNWN